jgi:hypothetical protein
MVVSPSIMALEPLAEREPAADFEPPLVLRPLLVDSICALRRGIVDASGRGSLTIGMTWQLSTLG